MSFSNNLSDNTPCLLGILNYRGGGDGVPIYNVTQTGMARLLAMLSCFFAVVTLKCCQYWTEYIFTVWDLQVLRFVESGRCGSRVGSNDYDVMTIDYDVTVTQDEHIFPSVICD